MSDEGVHAGATVVGLTGGIGSGKSTVASMFAELGVPVLDLDKVGHRVTAPGSEGLAALTRQFGEEILDGDELNRRRLAAICFASDEKTRQLNSIVHPLIWQQAEHWQKKQRTAYTVIEASVLIESGGCERVDRLIVVMAELPIRRRRVLQRGNVSDATFNTIVARQCDDQARLRHADDVIDNNGDIEALRAQVEALHAGLTGHFDS